MRRAFAIAVLLALVALSALAPAGQAKTAFTDVTVGKVALAPLPHGRGVLLVRVAYPIDLLGRRFDLEVFVDRPGGGRQRLFGAPIALSGGLPRTPERRGRFRFVHQVVLDAAQTRAAREAGQVEVKADGSLDVNHDGVLELSAQGQARRPLGGSGTPVCGTVPLLRSYYSRRVSVKLPACTSPRRWRVASSPEHGRVRIHSPWLTYTPAAKFRGTDTLSLVASPPRGASASAEPLSEPVVVRVGSAAHAVVRAMGDSVTAGFGYYDTGRPMPLVNLLECKPGNVKLIDSCSSNSVVVSNEAKEVEYAPDYGLANNISWAAQWSNEHGISDYENLAISGSEPGQWAPGGPLYATTKQIESEDPDYILMTLGANPLLDEMLFGIDSMGCAIYSDIFGGYQECVEESFAKIRLHESLEDIYRELVKNTDATIYLMQYHLSIPSTALAYSAVQIAEVAKLMNAEIAKVASEVNPQRLQVVTPPHFNVGIDLSPVYPSKYSCSRLDYKVDGPSVQIGATQDELLISHPLSFCRGPVTGPPWVITGDTGIHPSATGYTQMASQIPAPE
ncbi:MAG TPA: Ig-like domain-containing protein [Solirubrobacterales bacterium]|nr:Ig-like domain-containing protein [Solirubrobacterales bacterium]